MKYIGKVLMMLLLILGVSGCQTSRAYEAKQPPMSDQLAEAVNEDAENTEGELEIYFLDTGNSDCIFINAEQKVLIDAGDNDDELMIVDFLKALKIEKIDYLVNTHPDADHAGGLDAVIENFAIGTVFISNGSAESKTYRDFVNAAVDKGLSPSVPLADKLFYLQPEMFMRFYNTEAKGSGNEVSLIVELVYKQQRFLFMGDAEKAQELAVLDQLDDVDLVKIGHHGSRTSTSQELLERIKPEIAVILCGKNNSYGHPHQEVLDRLTAYGIEMYRTDLQGTLHVHSDGVNLSIEAMAESDKLSNDKNTSAAEEAEYYIGNLNSKKFHLAECNSLPAEKNQIIFDSYEDAVNQGYTPCKVCNP